MGFGLSPVDASREPGLDNDQSLYAIATVLDLPEIPTEAGTDWVKLDADALETLLDEVWQQIEGDGETSHPLAVPLQRHLRRARHAIRFDAKTALESWGWAANILWWRPGDGKLTDPADQLLWAKEAESSIDPKAQIPFLVDSRQRRVESETMIRNRNLDPVDGVAPLPGVSEIETFAPSLVARRMLGLFAVAARAEAMANGQTLDLDRVRQRSTLAAESLTPAERDFFDLISPPPEMVDSAAWRYESLSTLQWALQMQPELSWPDEHCDLPSVLRLVLSLPHEDVVSQAILRPIPELLQAADLHVSLWWIVAMAGAAGHDAPGGLDAGVIAERVQALTWVLQLAGCVPEAAADASWDHIDRELQLGRVG